MNAQQALDTLNLFKKKTLEIFGSDVEFNESLYFGTWFLNEPGSAVARTLLGEWKLWKFIKFTLLRYFQMIFLSIKYRSTCYFFSHELSQNINKALCTWVSWDDYQNGKFLTQDRYFGSPDWISSPHLLRIVIPYGENQPTLRDVKIFPNTILFYNYKVPKIIFFLPNFLRIARAKISFLKGFFSHKSSFKERCVMGFVGLSQHTIRSQQSTHLHKYMSHVLRKQNFKNIELLLPYEGQPEQLAVIDAWKKNAGNVSAYIHATLMNFPGTYIKPSHIIIDKFIAHGTSYEKILRFLGWQNSQVAVHPSMRFLKPRKDLAMGAVYLSITAPQTQQHIKKMLEAAQALGYQIENIKSHPLSNSSNTIDWLTQNKTTSKKCIVFEGSTTALFEALESGTECDILHISSTSSFLDRLDNGLWDDWLDITTLNSDGLFEVKLRTKTSFLIFPV